MPSLDEYFSINGRPRFFWDAFETDLDSAGGSTPRHRPSNEKQIAPLVFSLPKSGFADVSGLRRRASTLPPTGARGPHPRPRRLQLSLNHALRRILRRKFSALWMIFDGYSQGAEAGCPLIVTTGAAAGEPHLP